MRIALILSMILTLASCGGSHETASHETASHETTSSGSEHASWPAWSEMTHEQRGHYMAEVVMPEMRPVFQGHDATRYAEFGCATCHGANAHEVEFRMPNGLHPLDHAAIMATFQSTEPGATWMTQEVWPRMARLVGEQPFDMQTMTGFRCVRCHADGEPAAH